MERRQVLQLFQQGMLTRKVHVGLVGTPRH
jgi:hypothetical protein